MNLTFRDDANNVITVERKAPGLYRLWGTKPDGTWREWTATSSEIPNIERLTQELQTLSEVIVRGISQKGA